MLRMNWKVTCNAWNATLRMLVGRKTFGLLSALLTGRAMDVYARMSDDDAKDYNKLKKAVLTRYNFTEDGCRKRFR